MSVKKLLVLSAAGIALVGSTAALAGGPDACVPPVYQPTMYVEGNVGYVYSDWTANVANLGTGKGGFTGFGDIGYQWARNFAAEFGGGYLPGGSNTVTSHYFLYGALRMTAAVWDKLDIFTKAGLVWNSWSGGGARRSYVNALFALGLLYPFYQNWTVNAQFTFIPGFGGSGTTAVLTSNNSPNNYLFTGGVGYTFSI